MNPSLLPWSKLSLMCAVLWLISMTEARSAPACTFTAVPNIHLGTYHPTNGSSASATVGWSCTHPDNQTAYIQLCINIGAGSGGGTPGSSRLLSDGAGHTLGFQLYKTPAIDPTQIWGAPETPAWGNVQTTVPALSSRRRTATGSVTLYGNAPAGQASTVLPGTYTSAFTDAIALKYAYRLGGGGNPVWPSDCQTGTFGNVASTFTVTANVAPACVVTATDLNFGTAQGLAATGHVDGQSTVSVNCSQLTPYTVALTPSNGSSTGAGLLSPTGSVADNTDKIPYQLYRDTARTSNSFWGNTLGTNTVPGQGSGTLQSFPVYGRVLGANFTPDSYQDSVTVNVHY